jgi:predicted short-subunit dehydrogenase-like oxidoreductase (DUF2520 family)
VTPEAGISVRELDSIAIVGAGRLGTTLAAALGAPSPLGRGANARGATTVLLCVPDSEIAAAAAAVERGPLVGHCSGATGLDVLHEHEAFSLHPLMTVPAGAPRDVLAGAGCAVDGSTPRALAVAEALATRLGMRSTRVAGDDRAAYHAAASIASNFMVALQESAADLMAEAGIDDARELLAPLVLRTAANWAEHGDAALTGPVARGDEETVAQHLDALRETAPELLPLYEALAERTRAVAGKR